MGRPLILQLGPSEEDPAALPDVLAVQLWADSCRRFALLRRLLAGKIRCDEPKTKITLELEE